MEWLTFCFAILGCLSCASFLLYWCHRLTKNKDEFIFGVLYILLLMILCALVPLSIYIFWKNTIELIPSKSKSIIETLESNNDSLKNEISCPECNNIIELDWGNDEGCGNGCEHCHHHDEQEDEYEDDDM